MDRIVNAFGILLVAGTVAHGQGTVEAEKVVITEALNYAGTLLQQPRCASVFGAGAAETLRNAQYRFVPMGRPKLRPDGTVLVTSAATLKEFNLVLINREGPFIQPSMTSTRIGGLGVDFRFGLAAVPYRALMLLHELGHLMAAFKPDASDSALASSYTQLVLKSCF